jgi:hypothetical protein
LDLLGPKQITPQISESSLKYLDNNESGMSGLSIEKKPNPEKIFGSALSIKEVSVNTSQEIVS